MQISIQIQRPQSLSKLNLFAGVEWEEEQNRNWQINDFPFISHVCSLSL